ncbi:MAG TPA: regulatory iron-sulfur-containing complex subunit RicT [Gemmatimonadaceae bacterium]|nr:regulatory iron-sulfur-containing complex subunit RicT [Gemmatimonadaceae bacterium]
MQLIEVAFKGNRKEFFRWDAEEVLSLRTPVIVEADRGEDLGHVHATGELALKRSRGTPHGIGDAVPARAIRRRASDEEAAAERLLRADDEDARRRAMERVKANGLVMKLTDAEWQWDRRKLTLYFTAEKRVDFRNLVRELAAMFRTRIELKQIGVRDEAKRLDGIGRCGRQYCSASWLPELRPVNLGVAKDQRLSLNPSQISGACGRLMCSLRYEHAFYVQARKRFPKEGKILRTALGEEKVVANDIFRERVALRNSEGEVRTVPLVALRAEVEQIAQEFGLAAPTFGAPAEPAEGAEAETGGDDSVLETVEIRSNRRGQPERPPQDRHPAEGRKRPRQEAAERPRREGEDRPRPEAGERPRREGGDKPRREGPARDTRSSQRAAPDAPAHPPASVDVRVESAGDTLDADVPPVTVTSDPAGPADQPPTSDARRPGRRRGRRGGRRNRPGGPPRDGDAPQNPQGPSSGEHE